MFYKPHYAIYPISKLILTKLSGNILKHLLNHSYKFEPVNQIKSLKAWAWEPGVRGVLQHPLEKIRGCAAPPAKFLLTII